MPALRKGERMQSCEHEDHTKIRSQKYYIVRKYYNELESHFCQGCLNLMETRGLVAYSSSEGYTPIKSTDTTTLLNIYGKGIK